MKGNDLYPRLLYLAKVSIRMEGQIKCFTDKVTLKEFIITKTLERELSNEEIANLPDREFKALIIKMFTELIELGQKMKKQIK